MTNIKQSVINTLKKNINDIEMSMTEMETTRDDSTTSESVYEELNVMIENCKEEMEQLVNDVAFELSMTNADVAYAVVSQ